MLSAAAFNVPFIPSFSGSADGNLRPFAAEIVLVCTIVAVLLTPFFIRKSNLASGLVALAGLMLSLVALFFAHGGGAGMQFRGMLLSDPVAVLWKAMLLLFVIGIVLMWFATTRSSMHEGDGPEFFTLLLGATLGMALMVSTSNLLVLVMAVETASLPSYVLAGFRKTHRVGAEASLKYVLFGEATSSIMVYGLSLLYGMYGSLQLGELAQQVTKMSAPPLLVVAVVGLIVGIGFKIAAVPFHFWCPDVFEGAGIDVAAFLSVASKGAGLLLLARVVSTFAEAYGHHSAQPLKYVLVVIGVLGALTATVGNTAAYVQNNIKRLLAYSSIAHAGYMLCAVTLFQSAPPILFYLAVYLFMNLGAFTVAALVWKRTGSEDLSAFAGLGERSPLIAACMAIFMFSLIGLPPFAGFSAKLTVMIALGAAGGWWWSLVVVIGINTILSLYYYVRILKMMYLTSSDQPAFVPSAIGSALAVACAAMMLVLFIGYGQLSKVSNHYGRFVLGLPPAYHAPVPIASVER